MCCRVCQQSPLGYPHKSRCRSVLHPTPRPLHLPRRINPYRPQHPPPVITHTYTHTHTHTPTHPHKHRFIKGQLSEKLFILLLHSMQEYIHVPICLHSHLFSISTSRYRNRKTTARTYLVCVSSHIITIPALTGYGLALFLPAL